MTGKIGWYLSVAAICLVPAAAAADDAIPDEDSATTQVAADDEKGQDGSDQKMGEEGQGEGQTQGGGDEGGFTLEGEPGMAAEEKKEPSWKTQSELNYSSSIELGVLYNSTNSAKEGEYTGITDQGFYGIGNFDVRLRSPYDSEDTEFLKMEGSNLGLDSREVRIEGGRQGTIKGYIDYDQIPKFMSDTAGTIFNGAGGTNLTLTPNWLATPPANTTSAGFNALVDRNFMPVDLDYDRKQINGGVEYNLGGNWQLRGNYQHEWKQGLQTIGGIIGSPGGRAILLPQPLDYVTDQGTATVAYADDRYQGELSFNFSLFDNKDPSLMWHNAFTAGTGASALNDPAALGLPPSNEAYQISYSGAYNIDPETSTRVNLDASYGWMLQNDPFLPYTVNPALVITTPLPRDSLNGEINTAFVNLRVTSHPWDDVHLRGGYVFDDRDNQTPVALYNYVRTDAENQNTASVARMRYNLPYSFTTNKVDVEGDYDFMPSTTGTLGYEFENINRTYQEVSDTRENTFSARFRTMPVDFATVSLNGSFARRRGTNYDCSTFGTVGFPPPGEGCIIDPELRKDYEANRNRFRWGNSLTITPTDDVSFGIKTDFVRDHYTDSLLGLQNRDTNSFSVDASTSAIPDVTLYGYYTLFLVSQRQLGTNSAGDPTAHYQVREYDTVNTIGTGFEWMAIPDRLDINFDYLFQFATTEYDFRNGPTITTQPLPDLKTRYQTASLLGTYHIQKDLALKLGYQFQWFQTFDWAYTNVDFSQVNNVLGMWGVGIGSSEDYIAHIGMVSAVVDF